MSGEFANSANLFPTRIILNEWCTRQDSNLWPLPSELEPLPYSMLRQPSPKPDKSLCFIGFFDNEGPTKYSKRRQPFRFVRSEEHTSELQSLLRISYAVFCLKKQKTN